MTVLDLIKCLLQVKLHILLHTCAQISKLPSTISRADPDPRHCPSWIRIHIEKIFKQRCYSYNSLSPSVLASVRPSGLSTSKYCLFFYISDGVTMITVTKNVKPKCFFESIFSEEGVENFPFFCQIYIYLTLCLHLHIFNIYFYSFRSGQRRKTCPGVWTIW